MIRGNSVCMGSVTRRVVCHVTRRVMCHLTGNVEGHVTEVITVKAAGVGHVTGRA